MHFYVILALFASHGNSLEGRMYAFLRYSSPLCYSWQQLGKQNVCMLEIYSETYVVLGDGFWKLARTFYETRDCEARALHN